MTQMTTTEPTTEAPQPRKTHHLRTTLLATGGGFLALAVLGGVLSGGSTKTTPAPAPKTSTSAPATHTAPAPAKPSAPAPAATAPAPAPSHSAPAMTVAEQQAVDSAQSYLDMGKGFSRSGLIEQLTSSAGEGFAVADATYAVDQLNPDWNAQAVESAKGYMEMGGFSHASLMEQLTSSAGEGFTEAQAAYAVTQVGL